MFWYIGGTDPDVYDKAKQAGRVTQDIPTNHSPNFAPAIHPTLETGVEAMVVAASLVVVVTRITARNGLGAIACHLSRC